MLETFIAPIPSALIPMAAGFILISTNASLAEALTRCFYTIGLIGALATTIGSYFGYGVGYLGGKTIIDKWGNT